MEINKEDIKVVITASGAVFVGQEFENQVDTGFGGTKSNKKHLVYPFRFMVDQSSGIASVAAPVFREEWIIIDMTGAIECQLNSTVEELYRKYCQQVFSPIILPEEKKLII